MTGLYSYDEFVLNEGLVDNVKNKAKKIKIKAQLKILKEKEKKIDLDGNSMWGIWQIALETPTYVYRFIDECDYDKFLKIKASENKLETELAELDEDKDKIERCKNNEQDIAVCAKVYQLICKYMDGLFQKDVDTSDVDGDDSQDVIKEWVEYYKALLQLVPAEEDNIKDSVEGVLKHYEEKLKKENNN